MSRDTDHVSDIVSAARWIELYVAEVSAEEFAGDPMRQDAVVRQITIIGEAARRLSEDFRLAHSEIPWREIIGMRNMAVHAYDRIDVGEVWRVACHDVTELVESLTPLLPPLPPPDEL